MKRISALIFVSVIFLLGTVSANAAPVHEIDSEYEKGGWSYKVGAGFFDRSSSAQSLAIVDGQMKESASEIPQIKISSEKELKVASTAFASLKKDSEFKQWAAETDYYVIISAVNETTGIVEMYYIVSRRLNGKDMVSSKVWIGKRKEE
jgi:hypothetical protein